MDDPKWLAFYGVLQVNARIALDRTLAALDPYLVQLRLEQRAS